MREIDPSSAAGIALTVLSYSAGVSFLLWLSQILLAPYFWYITYREYGLRLFLWHREVLALRRKYPVYRFVWSASMWLAIVCLLSLFGMGVVFARYSV